MDLIPVCYYIACLYGTVTSNGDQDSPQVLGNRQLVKYCAQLLRLPKPDLAAKVFEWPVADKGGRRQHPPRDS